MNSGLPCRYHSTNAQHYLIRHLRFVILAAVEVVKRRTLPLKVHEINSVDSFIA